VSESAPASMLSLTAVPVNESRLSALRSPTIVFVVDWSLKLGNSRRPSVVSRVSSSTTLRPIRRGDRQWRVSGHHDFHPFADLHDPSIRVVRSETPIPQSSSENRPHRSTECGRDRLSPGWNPCLRRFGSHT
jgi:hypothetical protein